MHNCIVQINTHESQETKYVDRYATLESSSSPPCATSFALIVSSCNKAKVHFSKPAKYLTTRTSARKWKPQCSTSIFHVTSACKAKVFVTHQWKYFCLTKIGFCFSLTTGRKMLNELHTFEFWFDLGKTCNYLNRTHTPKVIKSHLTRTQNMHNIIYNKSQGFFYELSSTIIEPKLDCC